LSKFRKIKELLLPRFTRETCKEKGYHIFNNMDLTGHRVFTKDFDLGDLVYFLGHDGVGGWWYYDTTTADEEMMRKKDNLHFYRMIGKLKN